MKKKSNSHSLITAIDSTVESYGYALCLDRGLDAHVLTSQIPTTMYSLSSMRTDSRYIYIPQIDI